MKAQMKKVITRKVRLKSEEEMPPKENLLDNEYVKDGLKFAQDMLSCNKVRLQDIPFRLRTTNLGIYTTALTISRSFSLERYMEDLKTLESDLKFCKPPIRYQLEKKHEELKSQKRILNSI